METARESGNEFESDAVSQGFQATDQATLDSGAVALVELGSAEVVVSGVGGGVAEQMARDAETGAAEGGGRSLGSTTAARTVGGMVWFG